MAVGACSTALILGAYYYTWYGVGEQWQVFPRTFEPTMGEYHSASDDVMRIHHSQGQEACLDFFAVSWGGDGTRSHGKHRIDSAPEPVVGRCVVHDSDGVHMSPFCTDNEGNEVEPARGHLYKVQGWKEAMRWWTPSADVDTLIQRHFEVPDGIPMALMYELRDVLGVGENQGQVDLSLGNEAVIEHHLLYAAERYFKHPRYFRIKGRPVLFLYTLRDYVNFEAPLARVLAKVKARIGTDLHLIGDMVWWSPPPENFPWESYQNIGISTVTAYNMYDETAVPFMGTRFPAEATRHFLRVAHYANRHNISVAPYVSPGYDDRKMRGRQRPYVPRAQGSMYLRAWQAVQWLLQCQPTNPKPGPAGAKPLMMVNSFNEWHEGTQIEPSVEFGRSYLDYTRAFKARASAKMLTDEREIKEACEPAAENFERWFRWEGNWSDALALGQNHWKQTVRNAAQRLAEAREAEQQRRLSRQEDPHDRSDPPEPWHVSSSLHSLLTLAVLLLAHRIRGRVGPPEIAAAVLGAWTLVSITQLLAAGAARDAQLDLLPLNPARTHSRSGRAHRGRRGQEAAQEPVVKVEDVLHSWAQTALGPVVKEAEAIWREADQGLKESYRESPALPFNCPRWAAHYAMSPWPIADRDFDHFCYCD